MSKSLLELVTDYKVKKQESVNMETEIDKLKNSIKELNARLAEITPKYGFPTPDNSVWEIGERAILENCGNCSWLSDNKVYLSLDRCKKCSYNYDSYFEEQEEEE